MSEQPSSPVYAQFSWRAALVASVSGGVVFALLHVGLMWAVYRVSPWVPARMIAAILLGPGVLSPPDAFDVVVLLAAISLHGMLSIVYGVLLALLLPTANTTWTIVIGGLYGLALYYVNFYGLNAFSPWFIEERDVVSLVSHFVFGAVVASVYKVAHPCWYGAESEPDAPAKG